MAVRWMMVLWLASLAGWEAAAASAVTNCLAVLQMSRAEADPPRPVELLGVVTCYYPNSQLCFVQDETGGVYVYPLKWPRDLEAGDEVQVSGETAFGRFSGIVNIGQIEKTGRRRTIAPKKASIEELNTGKLDAQWVELEGVVQAQSAARDTTTLELWTGGSSAKVLLFGGPHAATNFVDARVAARGVAGTFYHEGQLTGFGLFVNGLPGMEVLSPPPEPFDRTERPIAQPFFFSSEGAMDRRVRIKGAVAAYWPGEAVFVQDPTGTILVENLGEEKYMPGDRIEVSGFVRNASTSPWLAGAVTRKTGSGAALAVRDRTEEMLAPIGTSLVALEGTLLAMANLTNQTCAVLDVRGTPVSVFSPKSLEKILPGSQVRVTGVWHLPPKLWRNSSGPGVWLHHPDGIKVVAPPKVTESKPGSDSTKVLAAAGALGAAAVFGFVAVRKTRQARAESERARSARESLEDTQKELQRLNQARERLGRDLHDHIIQSIYAVGLNLDDTARQVRENPDHVENRLKMALAEINGVIRELRNVILGLETNAIEPREFRTAIKSLSLALGSEKSNRMRLDIEEGAVEALTALQATELMHIAREGLSNSLRHGHATTTTFALHPNGNSVRFTIEDDGVGFDAGNSERNGFGLRNMAKRAENLGAKFTIEARPGAGTRILLDIPKQKQHFSQSEPSSRSNR